ncbi:unnamed protein product [Caenorhabditis angaria]|uniref:BPTI/Kunitz inhibitor domain-containing protein n=1 Tax=Caenorhabditis angaria TaxID=860376 RepID=A0A9P1N956_9PELO|nr:unnamed protein product [Caenorhabditis angaria]
MISPSILSFLIIAFSYTANSERYGIFEDFCIDGTLAQKTKTGTTIWCDNSEECEGGWECVPSGQFHFSKPINYCCQVRESICSMPPNPGYGECFEEPRTKYYFDSLDLKCKKFQVISCNNKNQNQFDTLDQCTRFCQNTACLDGQSLFLARDNTPVDCENISCPPGYRCVYDKLFNRHVCCGHSPTGVCPIGSVSYSQARSTQPMRCTPSTVIDTCPADYVCTTQGLYSFCCSSHDALCPAGQQPYSHIVSKKSMKCNPMESSSCPPTYYCSTAVPGAQWGFCCSVHIEATCPIGTSAYIEINTRTPVRCTVGVTQCNVGYSCQSSQLGSLIGFCCTVPKMIFRIPERSNSNNFAYIPTTVITEAPTTKTQHETSHHPFFMMQNEGLGVFSTKTPKITRITSKYGVTSNYKPAVCPPRGSSVFYPNSQINVECTPAEGYEFSCPGTSSCVDAYLDLAGRKVCCNMPKTTPSPSFVYFVTALPKIIRYQTTDMFCPYAIQHSKCHPSKSTSIDENDAMKFELLFKIVIYAGLIFVAHPNRYADQLYEDLLYYYNKNVRPVKNASESVKVKFGASLIRLIDVDEVNQVLTTNLWLEMQWFDHRLIWDPVKYGNIRKLHIPVDQIWIPDILLYNNADGEPHITIMSDALVYFNGLIVWKPPSIYKSFCSINIEYFPYDTQTCSMKFGGWTYNGFLLDVRQLPTSDSEIQSKIDLDGSHFQYLERGMDLSGYYPSLEWDLMKLCSARHEKVYAGCCGQDFYIDVTFTIEIRRKTLFYTVNLMIPCMMFAILTSIVFYVPPIEHKMTFSISILVTLTVFYLILIDLVPPTSLVIPLIGKYLLFTMFLVSISIMLSVISLNFYRRDGSSFPMPHWMRVVFISTLPKYIWIKTADEDDASDRDSSISDITPFMDSRRPSPFFISVPNNLPPNGRSNSRRKKGMHPDLIRNMIQNVVFISEYFQSIKKEDKISEDWSYVANVIDRIFLIIFSILNVAGTWAILYNAPAMTDTRDPLSINTVAQPLSGDTFENSINENFTLISWWSNDDSVLLQQTTGFF